jgi:hypothetical protein
MRSTILALKKLRKGLIVDREAEVATKCQVGNKKFQKNLVLIVVASF